MPYLQAMTSLTLTSKGQITLKKQVLAHLDVGPGSVVNVELLPDGAVCLRAAPKENISRAFGLLHRPAAQVLSLGEIAQIIEDSWSDQQRANKSSAP
jgi:antitoxin PrlF